jgi:hypothetical protein
LPFLPLFGFVSHVISLRMLNSSRFAGMDTLAFGVLGGKNGKKRQRSGKVWQDERQERHGLVVLPPRPRQQRHRCQQARMAELARYAVVQGAGGVW